MPQLASRPAHRLAIQVHMCAGHRERPGQTGGPARAEPLTDDNDTPTALTLASADPDAAPDGAVMDSAL